MSTLEQFKFYPLFSELENFKNITVHNINKMLTKKIDAEDICMGNRQVGSRSYHIFYFKNDRFSLYYHGGGTDSLYSSKSLDEILEYVNNLNPEDFE
ncbi:hypothetical protein DIC82_12210 [Clostridium beijerinckii]|nr:hypothetical protein DIC82_12210 [Clostridium beijerinckii]